MIGKTIQTVCFLHQLRFMTTTKVPGPFLIISPLSLIDQWQSEINTWSPEMNCVLLHGNAEARDLMVKNEFYYHEPFSTRADAMALKKAGVFKFNVLLTTYEMAVKDVRILAKIEWQVRQVKCSILLYCIVLYYVILYFIITCITFL